MEKDFRVKDLYLASYLFASKKKLVSLEKESTSYYVFVFEDVPGCTALVESYWRQEAEVNLFDYLNALRNLKDRLFGLLKAGRQ